MIPYKLPEEKESLLHYANLLNDKLTENIIKKDQIETQEEAEHLACFFWNMVDASNSEDLKSGTSSDYILEKIIITLMAYFRSSGYEDIWERIAGER